MKVLSVCEGFNKNSVHAQPWKHVLEVSKELRNINTRTTVLTENVTSLPSEEKIENITVERIKKGKILFELTYLL